MKKVTKNKELIIYQAKNGAIELKVDKSEETIWANINQIAELFSWLSCKFEKYYTISYSNNKSFARVSSQRLQLVALVTQMLK